MRLFLTLSKLVSAILLITAAVNCYGMVRSKPLEGFNWYTEKKPAITEELEPLTNPEAILEENKLSKEQLPEYEKNIRALQEMHEKAHRQALDNPTTENLLLELRLEKEMMDKSKLYGERRVAVAMLDSQFTNMRGHSNVLHRRIQEEVDTMEEHEQLVKLSNDWGLVVQVQEGCQFCHAFAPILKEFASKYGFDLIAATADGSDFEDIGGVEDNGKMDMYNPGHETPVLYLIKKDGTDLRLISRGINNEGQIINNIKASDKHFKRLFQ